MGTKQPPRTRPVWGRPGRDVRGPGVPSKVSRETPRPLGPCTRSPLGCRQMQSWGPTPLHCSGAGRADRRAGHPGAVAGPCWPALTLAGLPPGALALPGSLACVSADTKLGPKPGRKTRRLLSGGHRTALRRGLRSSSPSPPAVALSLPTPAPRRGRAGATPWGPRCPLDSGHRHVTGGKNGTWDPELPRNIAVVAWKGPHHARAGGCQGAGSVTPTSATHPSAKASVSALTVSTPGSSPQRCFTVDKGGPCGATRTPGKTPVSPADSGVWQSLELRT